MIQLSRSRPMKPFLMLLVCIAASVLILGCDTKSPQTAAADQSAEELKKEPAPEAGLAPRTIAVPSGTSITVRLLQTVSSRSARPGDEFDAELAESVVVNASTVIPARVRVRGRVVAAKGSGRLHDPGYVRIALDAFQTGDGNWVNIDTNTVSRSGGSHKKRNLALIGGGAGVGAIVGGIAGGGKGSAIGAAAGAGAGTAGAYATGEKDVSFPAESKLTFRLQTALLLSP
jgi:hypothetical protein